MCGMRSVAQRLLRIGSFLVGTLAFVAGDRPLGDLDADAVLAGLEGELIAGNVDDFADHAADGDDLIADFDAVTHLLRFLLALLFGDDHQEVEHSDD